MENPDVIVVGAGPAGLLLAGELGAGGARVTVLERLTEPMTESRASTLHSRTMEIFAERGILGRLGTLASGGSGHFGGIPLDLTAAHPAHPYAGQWKCPQTLVEAVLRDWAVEQGARIRRGHEVVGLTQGPDRVDVEIRGADGSPGRLAAAYLVGCDGEQSTVRRLAGFDFAGHDASLEMLRADVAGVDLPNRRFERLARGLATAHRWPDGTTRVMVHRYGDRPKPRTGPPDFTEVASAWAEVTGEDISGGTPVWLNVFGNTSRQATCYRRGRVLLAGDAAHAQMPVGGQAINLGLQDAEDLGRKLAAQIAGGADGEPLDSYHRDRHPAGARTLANIRAQALLLLGGPEVEGMRATFAELMGIASVQAHLARTISGVTPPAADPAPTSAPARRGGQTSRPAYAHRSSAMDRLVSKTALVTGASRGIGRSIAIHLAREGALVAVHYAENADGAGETVKLIEKDGGRAFPVRADFRSPGGVHELFLGLEQGLKERTGRTGLDIVVNNAGQTTPNGLSPEDVLPEQLDELFMVNAQAPFFIVQRAIGLMPSGGRIVNISSGLTRFANPEQVAYSLTKGAIEQITLHFAKYVAPRGITVNSVAPGITNNGSPVFDIPEAVEQMSQLSAFKRVGEGRDVADVVTFLATDEARWITGAFIDATGGTLLG